MNEKEKAQLRKEQNCPYHSCEECEIRCCPAKCLDSLRDIKGDSVLTARDVMPIILSTAALRNMVNRLSVDDVHGLRTYMTDAEGKIVAQLQH